MLSILCCFTDQGGSKDDEKRKGKSVKRVVHKRPRSSAVQELALEAELENMRRHRLTNLRTLQGLSSDDYFSMRDFISYEHEKTATHQHFWKMEQ